MSLFGMMARQKSSDQVAKATECGSCPKCGQKMDNAGWGYCRCMNPECGNMGKKVKA